MRDARHPDDRLSAFLDDELDEAAALAVAHHVADCPDCWAELEALRATRRALRGLPRLEPPEELLAAARLAAEGRQARRQRLVRAGVAVGAGVAGVLAAAFVLGEPVDGDVVPPVDVFVVDHVTRTGGGPVLTPVHFERP